MPEPRNPEDATREVDILVAGSGPAGLAMAVEAQDLGARVAVVAPEPEARWVPTWCAFESDLPPRPTGRTDGVVARCLHQAGSVSRWSSARIALDSREQIDARPYVQIDGPALQHHLLDAFRDAGGILLDACVHHVEPPVPSRASSGAPTRVTIASTGSGEQRTIAARQVVDCTGEAQVLGPEVAGARPTAYQTAFGLEIDTDGHPWAPDQATWMDLTDLQDPPSFLYVLPRDARRVFVEETALAARPRVSLELLEQRLHARLARLGVSIRAIHATERCSIPLDMPAPAGLAYGTAGGMVHPATGYLLTRVLSGARSFARAVLDGHGARELARLRGGATRRLHLLGLDVLVGCDGPALGRFFERFFAMPAPRREAFLAVQPRLAPTVWAMTRLFIDAPFSLKLQLAGPLISSTPPQAPPSSVLPGHDPDESPHTTSEVACPHS